MNLILNEIRTHRQNSQNELAYQKLKQINPQTLSYDQKFIWGYEMSICAYWVNQLVDAYEATQIMADLLKSSKINLLNTTNTNLSNIINNNAFLYSEWSKNVSVRLKIVSFKNSHFKVATNEKLVVCGPYDESVDALMIPQHDIIYRPYTDISFFQSKNIKIEDERTNPDLVIGLLACCTKEKYQNQIKACLRTWMNNTTQTNIYFLNGESCGLGKECAPSIHLKGVADDYYSASLKQWYGLKELYQRHPQSKYYYIAGTDTYIRIEKVLNILKSFNPKKMIYFGGHGDDRLINAEKVYFHSGGSGFILSNPVMAVIDQLILGWIKEWENLTVNSDLRPACDVALAYFLKKYTQTETIVSDTFRGCNWRGYGQNKTFKCCSQDTNLETVYVCHFMEPEDMDRYDHFLKDEMTRYHFNFEQINETPLQLLSQSFVSSKRLKGNTTVVTAFYNIEKIKDEVYPRYGVKVEQYFKKHSFELMKLDLPMVIFVDEGMYEWVYQERKRNNLLEKTVILTFELTKSPYYCYVPIIEEAFKKNKQGLLIEVGDYQKIILPLIWSKVKFMETAIRKNLFSSKHFSWVDFGILKINQGIHTHIELNDLILKTTSDKIMMYAISEPSKGQILNREHYFHSFRWTIIGGYFSLPKDKFNLFLDWWNQELIHSMKIVTPVSEEVLFSCIIARNRDCFDLRYADYHDIIRNKDGYYTSARVSHQHLVSLNQRSMWSSAIKLCRLILKGLQDKTLLYSSEEIMMISNQMVIAGWYGHNKEIRNKGAQMMQKYLPIVQVDAGTKNNYQQNILYGLSK